MHGRKESARKDVGSDWRRVGVVEKEEDKGGRG